MFYPLTPLTEWDTVQVQQGKRSIINGLIRVPSEIQDHGHGFILESQDYFRQRTGEHKAVLPKAPEHPDKALATTNHKKFIGNQHSIIIILRQNVLLFIYSKKLSRIV